MYEEKTKSTPRAGVWLERVWAKKWVGTSAATAHGAVYTNQLDTITQLDIETGSKDWSSGVRSRNFRFR